MANKSLQPTRKLPRAAEAQRCKHTKTQFIGGLMSTYNLDLHFVDSQKERVPIGPIAQIYVKTHSIDKESMICISPRCVSLREIEYECDRLIKEIESIRKKAKRKFTAK